MHWYSPKDKLPQDGEEVICINIASRTPILLTYITESNSFTDFDVEFSVDIIKAWCLSTDAYDDFINGETNNGN